MSDYSGPDAIKRLSEDLANFAAKVQRRVLRSALAKAARPIGKDAKSVVPRGTGLLKKSIGVAIKTNAQGAVRAIIGPRRGFREITAAGKVKSPSRYAHLVEFGFRAGTRQVAPRPFLRSAFNADIARQNIAAGLADGIAREAAKLSSRDTTASTEQVTL